MGNLTRGLWENNIFLLYLVTIFIYMLKYLKAQIFLLYFFILFLYKFSSV